MRQTEEGIAEYVIFINNLTKPFIIRPVTRLEKQLNIILYFNLVKEIPVKVGKYKLFIDKYKV